MTKQKTKSKRRTILFVLLGIILLLALFAWLKGNSKDKGITVYTAETALKTIKETVEASGKIFPQTEVKISSDVSGEVVELYVEEGDSVKQNQILAKIDPDAYQSAVERGVASVNNAKAQVANSTAGIERSKAGRTQAQAEVDRIKSQLTNTQNIHERNAGLFKEGVISKADFEASETNLQQLQANLRSSEANLKSADASLESARQSVKAAEYNVKSVEASLKEFQTNLKRTTIYAPNDGIVSLLNVEQGERVVGTIQMTGTELMRIANLNAMEVQVDVVENDVFRVSVNDPVEIEVDAYSDRTFKGKVTQIANSASNSSAAALTSDQVTNFIVKISVDPNSYRDLVTAQNKFPFRPGMSASVEINTNTEKDVLCVPIDAVTTRELDEDNDSEKNDDDDNIKEVVFVASADSVRMVTITTGIQDDNNIQVLSGLEENQEVIKGPFSAVSKKLKEGAEIKIVTEDEFTNMKKD